MNRPHSSLMEKLGLPLAVGVVLSLWVVTRFFPGSPPESAESHQSAERGGQVISLAGGRYHLDLVLEAEGRIRLYTLGADPSQVLTIDRQDLSVYLNTDRQRALPAVSLTPAPQAGDPPGETSCFAGKIPLDAADAVVAATIPNLHIHGNRYHAVFSFTDHEVRMPNGVGEQEAEELYLTPGGKYTLADIRSNGSTTAAQKYRGFQPEHDPQPKPGDTLCPVTQTKANAHCTWIINGQRYQFCCPPCIDEYVRLAKEHPERLEDPNTLIK